MIYTGKTITSVLWGSIRQIWDGNYDQLTESEAICYHNVLTAKSCEFEFDIADLGFTPSRFTKLLRAYLDAGDVHRFLRRATEIATGRSKKGAVCTLQTKRVLSTDTSHRFGNCLLGFCYHGLRTTQPTLTMHSRTAYVSYVGCLDLAVAFSLMSEISRRSEIRLSQCQLVWLSTSLQFHILKSLPLMRTRPNFLDQTPKNELQAAMINWHRKFSTPGAINGEAKFGPVRRVQKIYNESKSSQRSYPLVEWASLNPLTRA